MKVFDYLKQMTGKKRLCIGSYDIWFCIISWKKFANLLLLCEAPDEKMTFRKMSKGENLWCRKIGLKIFMKKSK